MQPPQATVEVSQPSAPIVQRQVEVPDVNPITGKTKGTKKVRDVYQSELYLVDKDEIEEFKKDILSDVTVIVNDEKQGCARNTWNGFQDLFNKYASVIFGTPSASYNPDFRGTQGSSTTSQSTKFGISI